MKCLVAQILSILFLSQHQVAAYWRKGAPPGMLARVEEKAFDDLRSFFSMHNQNFYQLLDLPTELNFELLAWLGDDLKYSFSYTDIQYSEPSVDFNKAEFRILREEFDVPVIQIDFPQISNLKITAKEHINTWIMPSDNDIEINIVDLDVDFKAYLVLDEHGYIDPIVYYSNIDFGQTVVKHSNWFTELLLGQVVELSLVIIENSSWAFGEFIFTNIMGPAMDKALNHYKWLIPIYEVRNKANKYMMYVDFRNTMDPYTADTYVDFEMLGEMIYHDQGCSSFDPEPLSFWPGGQSQFVLSDVAVTCMAEQLGKTEYNNAVFNGHTLWRPFNSSTFTEMDLPFFENKLGPGVPLTLKLQYKDMKITFGNEAANIILEFTQMITLSYDSSDPSFSALKLPDDKEIIYDELKLLVTLDAKVENDLLYLTYHKYELDIFDKYHYRDYPIRNSLNMSKQDYTQLLMDTKKMLNWYKGKLNWIFSYGVYYQYDFPEFRQDIQFGKHAAYFLYYSRD